MCLKGVDCIDILVNLQPAVFLPLASDCTQSKSKHSHTTTPAVGILTPLQYVLFMATLF